MQVAAKLLKALVKALGDAAFIGGVLAVLIILAILQGIARDEAPL